MHRYDARQTFIEGLLLRLVALVDAYHEPIAGDAGELVGAILSRDRFTGSYAEAARAIHLHLTGEPLTMGKQAA